MSKSVLVMDTPESCINCKVGQNMSNCMETCIRCPIAGKCTLDEEAESIPDWCPLKPLPEKFDNENDRKLGDFEPLFKIGWNACIDEITGEVK